MIQHQAFSLSQIWRKRTLQVSLQLIVISSHTMNSMMENFQNRHLFISHSMMMALIWELIITKQLYHVENTDLLVTSWHRSFDSPVNGMEWNGRRTKNKERLKNNFKKLSCKWEFRFTHLVISIVWELRRKKRRIERKVKVDWNCCCKLQSTLLTFSWAHNLSEEESLNGAMTKQ